MRVITCLLISLLLCMYFAAMSFVVGSTSDTLQQYYQLQLRIEKVSAIKPQLSKLEINIWNDISAYNAQEGKMVNFSIFVQNYLFDAWDKDIMVLYDASENKDVRTQLDILSRSLKVLARRVDDFRGEAVKKQLEDGSQGMFFDDSVVVAKDVYTDKMQKTMGQIRFSVGIVQKNIDNCVIADAKALSEYNSVAQKQARICQELAWYCASIGAILVLLTFIFIGRLRRG